MLVLRLKVLFLLMSMSLWLQPAPQPHPPPHAAPIFTFIAGSVPVRLSSLHFQ
jgi:hypothetical protein